MGAEGTETALFHFHGHDDADHDHGVSPDHDGPGEWAHAADLDDGDIGHIHLGHVAFMATAMSLHLQALARLRRCPWVSGPPNLPR